MSSFPAPPKGLYLLILIFGIRSLPNISIPVPVYGFIMYPTYAQEINFNRYFGRMSSPLWFKLGLRVTSPPRRKVFDDGGHINALPNFDCTLFQYRNLSHESPQHWSLFLCLRH